jgi:hypothetical protein
MKKLARFEKKSTLTDFNVSVAYKLTIARFINSALLLVFASVEEADTWFSSGGLVYNATVQIFIMSIVDPIQKILIGVIKNKAFKCCAKFNKGIT